MIPILDLLLGIDNKLNKLSNLEHQFIPNETKIDALKEFLTKNQLNPENVAYFGNEINDLACMKTVAYPIAPADACNEVKTIAYHITKSKGGEGVVREFIDFIK